MKHIGHVDLRASTWKTHSLGMLAPHDLFIPNPGERENVDADRWRHVGWINSDKDGGIILDSHSKAGENSRPAYIVRDEPVPVFQDGPHVSGPKVVYNGGKTDPMDVRRSEFEALRKDAEDAHRRLNAMLETVNIAVQRVNDLKLRLDQPAPLDDLTDLRKAIQTLARVQQHGPLAPSEPPMTFYDHAFIAAYIAASATMNRDLATKNAHTDAAHLTRNRVNQP